jgi:hypothetical protein
MLLPAADAKIWGFPLGWAIPFVLRPVTVNTQCLKVIRVIIYTLK